MNKNLNLNAVGGVVTLYATEEPSDGKAIIDVGGSGVTVSINGFAFTGSAVSSGNGAGIRYEGGTLNITNSHFYDDQDGILGAPDPNGTISIDHSEFNNNGAGDGLTHNIYIGDIAQFSLTNSYIHDAIVGHEVKSRAENNTITNNRILDNAGSASYEIDLPNGGNATISGNTIQQSVETQNPNIIAYGEEGKLHGGTSLSITGNTIVNDLGYGPALWNAGSTAATFSGNSVEGFGSNALVNGPANQSNTTVLSTRPVLDTSLPYPVAALPVATGSGLVVDVAEDAYQGDAQFTVSVDGEQVGGVYTATASNAAGQFQVVTAAAALTSGTHLIGVTFLNDQYGGSSSQDRNLYVTGASYNGVAIADAAAPLINDGTLAVLMNTGTMAQSASPSTAGLVVTVAEDAYLGNAEFLVTIDGTQVGVYEATASYAAGQSQAITVAGALSAGSHTIGISFLNDLSGPKQGQDRNLYVEGATYNGTSIGGAAQSLYSTGTDSFAVVSTGGTPAPTGPIAPPVAAPVAPPVSQPVAPPTALPAPTAAGLVVTVAEDAFQGDAQFTVTVDGAQVGGTYTATASHAAGQSQAITVAGALASGAHTVGINFTNDLYGGSASADRNLYVQAASYNGTAIGNAAKSLFSNSTDSFAVTVPGSTGLVLDVAEDAFQGDALFTVKVDGTQVGGTYAATASHAAGQSQAITVANVLGNGSHTVGVSFINDAYGGAPNMDRNLYVTGASYNGVAIPNAPATLFANGTSTFSATSNLTSTVVLNASEDAFQGDVQVTVAVDGAQIGGVYTVTASHAAGQSQAITLAGIPENFTAHDVAVTFLNDLYGGAPSADRNLYVTSATIDNQAIPAASFGLYQNGTQHIFPAAPSGYTG